MTQEEIISYLQIAHQLWVDGWLDIDEVSSYLDEIDHEMSVIDPKTKSIKIAFQDNWYPTLVYIDCNGKVTVSTDFTDL